MSSFIRTIDTNHDGDVCILDDGQHGAHAVPTWVANSALTVGLGAALINGSGLAHAEPAATSGSSSSASSSSTDNGTSKTAADRPGNPGDKHETCCAAAYW
ncbi:hypothetical protein [Mycolicibacterium sarraceniae]|uniref:hypothetical protein n=1 Tax=Mycolicibacterium sarraceniae TaxID=1534348 RepID=UPI0013D340BE|nr:hypothetical protein [Mycolicibacterium sarraceniae]